MNNPKIRLFTGWVSFLLLTIGISAHTQALEYTFTQAELQEQLEKTNLTVDHPLIQVKVTNPKILLDDKTQTAQLSGDVELNMLGSYTGEGYMTISGKPTYSPEKKAFYFESPEITKLTVREADPDRVEAIRLTLNQALQKWMNDLPIYKLNDKKLKEKMASATLESVSIKDKTLILNYSLF